MKYILVFFLGCFVSIGIQAQVLYSSQHSTPIGQAELNSFPIDCENDCFFTMFLDVSNLDFESAGESGAMLRVWNKDRSKYFLYGVRANKKNNEPEIVFIDGSGRDNFETIQLGTSKLNVWEGFRFSWKDKVFTVDNLRNYKKDGYSKLEESGISHEGALTFKPFSIEYLFLGVDLEFHVDIASQNINKQWSDLANGN